MIQLGFVQGSRVRRIKIDGKEVSIMSSETGFVPLKFNLDKLEENKDKFKEFKLTEEDIKVLNELKELGSEQKMANDIKKDFKKTGWKVIYER